MLSRLCAGSASEFCLQSMLPAASGSCCTGMSSRHACTTSIKVKALAPSTQASPDPYLPKVGNAFGVALLLATSILVLARNTGLYSSIAAPRACTSADAAAPDSTSVSGQCLSRFGPLHRLARIDREHRVDQLVYRPARVCAVQQLQGSCAPARPVRAVAHALCHSILRGAVHMFHGARCVSYLAHVALLTTSQCAGAAHAAASCWY